MRTIAELVGPAQFVRGNGEDWEFRSKPLTERGGDVYLVPHHSVSRTIGAIMAEFTSPYRTLSATVACGPDRAGEDAYRQIHAVPWNTGRPYTTSSDVDDKAITFEMANLVLSSPWPVGSTGKYWVAELAAAMHVELGMPLDRWHVACHSEIHARGWGSYATACCGDDLRNALDWVVEEAKRIVAGAGTQEEETMFPIIWNGKHLLTFGRGQVKHEAEYNNAQYVKNVLTADDKFIGANDSQLSGLCESFGVPWYAVDAVLNDKAFLITGGDFGKGRFWSREMEILSAIKGITIDTSALNQTIEASIASGMEGVSIEAQVSEGDIRRIAVANADELKARL